MALFSRTKKETPAVASPAPAEKPTSEKTAAVTDRDLSSVLQRPRVSEKAFGQTARSVYVFEVRKDATKYDVRDAVKALYNVTPVKVNIVNKQPRTFTSRRRGRTIHEKALKKAYVYLKAGDTINLI